MSRDLTTVAATAGAAWFSESTMKDRGVFFFILLSVGFVGAQVANYMHLDGLFFLVSLLLVALTFVYGLLFLSLSEAFIFLFLIISTRYITAVGGKELQVLVPIAFMVMLFILKGKQLPNKRVPVMFLIYALFLLAVVVRGFEFLDASRATTFARRWDYITVLACFVAGYYMTNGLRITHFVRVLFRFYFVVMLLAFIMLIFEISEMPLFNTFSWTKAPFDEHFGILSIAGAYCLLILVCVSDAVRNSVGRYGAMVLSLVAVFVAGGRASLLGVVVGLLGYLFFIRKRRRLVAGLVAAFFVIAQVGSIRSVADYLPRGVARVFEVINVEMMLAAVEELGEDTDLTAAQRLAGSSADWSSMSRLLMWHEGIKGVIEKPLVGQGLKNPFAGIDKNSLTVEEKMDVEALLETGYLHNSYFSLAYIAGIPAAFVFLAFVLSLIRKSYQLSQRSREPAYGLLLILSLHWFTISFVSDAYMSYGFLIFAGLVFSHHEMLNREKLADGA